MNYNKIVVLINKSSYARYVLKTMNDKCWYHCECRGPICELNGGGRVLFCNMIPKMEDCTVCFLYGKIGIRMASTKDMMSGKDIERMRYDAKVGAR